MKMFAAIAFAAVTAMSLAACETTYGHHGGAAVSADFVDGYYDDAYGPWYDGYWGPDDSFYYRANETDTFHRDDAGHVRRDAAQGYHTFHGRAARAPDAHR